MPNIQDMPKRNINEVIALNPILYSNITITILDKYIWQILSDTLSDRYAYLSF